MAADLGDGASASVDPMAEGVTSLLQGLGELGSIFLNDDLFSWQHPAAQLTQDLHLGSSSSQQGQQESSARGNQQAEGANPCAPLSKSLSKRSRRSSKSVEEELHTKLDALKTLTCENKLLQVDQQANRA
jgi:hypothetical protein